MRVVLLFVAASVLLAQQAPVSPGAPASQQEAPSKGMIRGVVLDVTTQEPVPDALIQLIPAGTRPTTRILVTSDKEGKFSLGELDPGRWTFVLYRNGFVYTHTGPPGMVRREEVLELGPGQVIDDVMLGLHPAAVINGRVVDENGAPMEGMLVEAAQYRYVEGARELLSVARGTSNDKGEYRIYGLHPGDYYVRVSVDSPMAQNSMRAFLGGNSGYVDTYYPNSDDVSLAGLVRVAAEAETFGIEFKMARTRALSVAGRVVGQSGSMAMGGSATLLDADQRGRQLNPRRIRLDPDGSFLAEGLKPGRYRIEATMFGRDRTRHFALYDFELSDRSIENLLIQPVPTFSVPGKVVVEGDIGEDANSQSGALLEPLGVYSSRFSFSYIQGDGRLLFESVSEDSYRVRGLNLRGLYLKSVRYDGRDAMSEPVRVSEGGGEFELVFSANGARLDGQVARRAEGVAGAQIVLMPEDRGNTDLIKNTATDQYGVFSFTGIAPGRYKVFAWERIERSAWLDPNVLAEAEAQGVSVEVKEGDAKRVTPKLIEAKD